MSDIFAFKLSNGLGAYEQPNPVKIHAIDRCCDRTLESKLLVSSFIDELKRLVGAFVAPIDFIGVHFGELEGGIVSLFDLSSLNRRHGSGATPARKRFSVCS